jgi:hypothetical protein
MAVGRITGPLLASNLLRDGVNLSVETDLLYLDVQTGRIGVKTSAPQYELDVNGTANVGVLRVSNTSTLGLITVTKTLTSGTIGSTLGPIHIDPAGNNKIYLDADTEVVGSLHASGDITADGNIRLGDTTSTDTLKVGAEFISNLIPKTPNTYNIGSASNNWNQGYFKDLFAGNMHMLGNTVTNILPGNIDIIPNDGVINLKGNVKIWGGTPLGTGPVTANTLYVNEDGSDTNDGGAIDASRACRTVSGATKSPLYKPGTSIKVAPGRYLENNPIEMKPYTSVIGSDLRTTIIEPINKTQDLFHVRQGCYVAQLMMYNGRSGRFPGTGYTSNTNRGAYATAFPPQGDNGQPIDVFHSPYIQNCTNQSGPWLYDGTMFVPNQTIQVPEGVGIATFDAGSQEITVTLTEGKVYAGQAINGAPPNPGFFNARTLLLSNKAFIQEQVVAYVDQTYGGPFQYNATKCARDTGLIIDGLGLDLIYNSTSQSVFSGLQYWSQTSTPTQIAGEETTTTNAINYINSIAQLVVRGQALSSPYQNTLTQVTNLPAGAIGDANRVSSLFTTATNIITQGTIGITDKIIPNGTTVTSNTSTQAAAALLQANKAFLKAEAVAWITANAPTFTYDKATCKRDVGYIIDCVTFDLLRGGNRQAIQAGTYYYGYSTTQSAIPNEQPQTIMAYEYMKSVITAVVQSQELTSFYQSEVAQVLDNVNPGTAAAASTLSNDIDVITRLIRVGPDGAPSLVPIGLTQTSDAGLLKAYNLLVANKNFIKAEVIAYVNTLPNFVYNKELCYRDTGIILENVSFDALAGGNEKTVEAGLAYYKGVTSVIAGQETQTVGAINYIKTLADKVIKNQTCPNLLGALAKNSQTINYVLTSGGIASNALADRFDIISNIITNGPTAAPTSYPGCAIDPYFMAAEVLLETNKSFIQQEIVAYVNESFLTFPFNSAKCRRDTALIVDAIAFDLLYPTADHSQSTFAGLQYFNQNGYTGLIGTELTTTTNAITYLSSIAQKIILNDISGPRYQSVSSQSTTGAAGTVIQSSSVGTNFDLIVDIILNGTTGVTDKIVPNGDELTTPGVVHAYAQLQTNKAYLIDEVIAYVESTKTSGFTYNQTTCRRDTGYIIDSICFDLLHGGNRQSIQSAVYYYSFNANSSAIPNEKPQTIAAYNHLKALVQNIVTSTPVARSRGNQLTQVTNLPPATTAEGEDLQDLVDVITNIINNGPSVVTNKRPISLTKSTSTSVQRAFALLQANRAFLANEIVAFINQTYNDSNFSYNKAKCFRDTGLIVDSLVGDLGWGSNGFINSNFAGLQYWNQNGYTGLIQSELTTTTNAINYLSSIAQKIVRNDVSGTRYQSTVTQVFNVLPPASAIEAQAIALDFSTVTSILIGGTTGVTDIVVPNGYTVVNANAQKAFDLLQANKSYLQAEVIAYVEATKTPGFVFNTVTCARDTRLIVDSIVQDLLFTTSSQATFSGLQYWNQNGYTGSIASEITTTTNAIEYVSSLAQKIVLNDTVGTRYQTTVTQVTNLLPGTTTEASRVESDFTVILRILQNGTDGVTDSIIPNGLTPSTYPNITQAYALLQANKAYIQSEAVAYVEATKTVGFTYDKAKCYRDVGYMLDSVSFDLLYGGNRQAIQSGVYYYSFNASSSAIQGERTETVAAFNYIKSIIDDIVTGTALVSPKQNILTQNTSLTPGTSTEAALAQGEVDIITNIITNGPSVVTNKTPINLTRSTNGNVINAANIIEANKEFIVQETLAYIATTYARGFDYDQAKCYRDVGYLIDSISHDILYGGNRQAVMSGVYYYGFDAQSTMVPNEQNQTVAAYDRLKQIVTAIITEQPIIPSAGNTAAQQFNNNPAPKEVGTTLLEMLGLITNIINNGPSQAIDKVAIPLTMNTDPGIQKAMILLDLNRTFIQNEIVAWTDTTYGTDSFNYNQEKCYRDVGLIVDAIAQDLLIGGNRKTIEAGVSYWTGGVNVIASEIPQNNAAMEYLKTVCTYVVTNTPLVGKISRGTQIINDYFDGGIYATQNIDRLIEILKNIIAKGPDVAPEGYEGSGAFNLISTSADNVQPASTILDVESLGGDRYKLYLSEPVLGPAIDGTLYFGQTSVYPTIEKYIPARWSQRKIDPLGSIGGSLVDGGVVSKRSPIQSFVYDAFTQVNQGGIGIKITNNGYAQLVSVFTIFCGTSVIVENGGICSITNSNANFGDYCLVAKGYGEREFFGEVYNPPQLPYYPNGFYPQNQIVEVFCPDPDNRPHIGLIMEVVVPEGYKNAQGLPGFLSAAINTSTLTTGSVTINGVDTDGIVIGQRIYARDQYGSYTDINGTRYIPEDTIVTDINFKSLSLSNSISAGGGDVNNVNYFTMYITGNAYYTVRSSSLAPDPIAPGTFKLGVTATAQGNDQGAEEIQALQYVNTLTSKIVTNTLIDSLQTTATQVTNITLSAGGQANIKIGQLFGTLEDIISNGLNAVPAITKEGIVAPGASDAAALLLSNKSFVQAEIIEYINNQYFVYDHATCRRDLGYILDGFAWDVLFQSNYQSIKSGNAYLRNVPGSKYVLDNEKAQTTDAITRLAAITNQTAGISTVTQAISIINVDGININNIINGNTAPGYNIPDSPGLDSGISNAKSLILNNLDFIKEEVIGYIDATYPVFTYSETKCKRDIGYIIDGVAADIVLGTNYRSVKSGQAYYKGNSTNLLANEKTQTLAAFSFVKDYLLTLNAVQASTTATQKITTDFATIQSILQTGLSASPTVTYTIPPGTATGFSSASQLLQANKAYIQAEVEAYIHVSYPALVYDRTKCARDVGFLLDALIYDLTYGGNSMSVDAALQYFDNANNNVRVNPTEVNETVAGINYIGTIASRIVQNLAPVVSYQNGVTQTTNNGLAQGSVAVSTISGLVSSMATIVQNGVNAVPTITEPGYSWATASVISAHDAIEAAKSLIASEAITYINEAFTVFTYDRDTCRRDLGYVIHSMIYDLTYGGNWQTRDAGLLYFDAKGNTLIPGTIPETVGAFNYLLNMMKYVSTNTAPAVSYQNTYSQFTNLSATNGANAHPRLTALTGILTDIVGNGPQVAPALEYPSTTGYSATLLNVKSIIETQKATLVNQVITYIDSKYNGFEYNQALCKRDVGYVIDALAADLLSGGNYNTVLCGKSYYAIADTHHYVLLEDNVADATLFPDKANINFYRRAYMSASGYLFEYVGAGSNYGSLPQVGRADPVQEREVVQLNNGKVFFTSTDQNGDFRIGPGLVISQATGVLSGRTFTKSLFANLTPFILAIEGI